MSEKRSGWLDRVMQIQCGNGFFVFFASGGVLKTSLTCLPAVYRSDYSSLLFVRVDFYKQPDAICEGFEFFQQCCLMSLPFLESQGCQFDSTFQYISSVVLLPSLVALSVISFYYSLCFIKKKNSEYCRGTEAH